MSFTGVCKKALLGYIGLVRKQRGKHKKRIQANITQLAQNQLLTGRVALITGGTSGIGYAIADAMLSANAAAVIITGRDEQRCKEAADKLILVHADRADRVFFMPMDMCRVDTFEQCFRAMQEKLGGLKISILVNNAGVQGGRWGSTTEADFDRVMDTNYKGVFFLSQLVASYMVEHEIQGNILNVASSSSLRPTNSAYSLSKACIKELTVGMAKFMIRHNIVGNGIAPGPTATPMMNVQSSDFLDHPTNPSGRYATPEEIANMAVVLTSDMCRMVVGDILYMTGGSGITTYDDANYSF